jgi:hypothetical protein
MQTCKFNILSSVSPIYRWIDTNDKNILELLVFTIT